VSQENVEIVRGLYDAYRRGDADTARAAIDPNVEWDSRHHVDGRVYHGHDGVREFFRNWLGLWESTDSRPEKFLDAGDRVVVLTVETTKAGGLEITERHAEIYTLRGRKVVHWCAFVNPADAVSAVGLPEETAVPDR
jgi:ketosteroid isomerase-like protein